MDGSRERGVVQRVLAVVGMLAIGTAHGDVRTHVADQEITGKKLLPKTGKFVLLSH